MDLGKGYWDSKKQGLLPWVKDWKDPQDQVRHSTNVRDMCWNDWFYCHTSAYSLVYYGSTGLYILFSGIGLYFSLGAANYIISFILAAFMFYMAYDLVKKINKWSRVKNMTFYDLYMREYD